MLVDRAVVCVKVEVEFEPTLFRAFRDAEYAVSTNRAKSRDLRESDYYTILECTSRGLRVRKPYV